MGNEIPYYLQANPVVTSTTPTFDVKKITDFSYDYDYQHVPENLSTRSFWSELAESTDETLAKTNQAVWNTAEGAWTSVKSVAGAAYSGVKSIGGDVVEGATGIFDSFLMRMLLIFAAIIAGLYILGKSGIIRDIVAGILAVR